MLIRIYIPVYTQYTGSFSTQIAQSAYEEVKKEVDAEKRAKISAEHPNSSNQSSSDTWEFMGLRVKPPKAILGITTGLTEATRRVDNVIADEVCVCIFPLMFISIYVGPYIRIRVLTLIVVM